MLHYTGGVVYYHDVLKIDKVINISVYVFEDNVPTFIFFCDVLVLICTPRRVEYSGAMNHAQHSFDSLSFCAIDARSRCRKSIQNWKVKINAKLEI